MEKNLEHKIKKAFEEKDSKSEYPFKPEMWKRIESVRKKDRSVPLFWRIASIFLVIVLLSGVFAGIVLINNNNRKMNQLKNENEKLILLIDSLQSITPKVITETKVLEKEVPVYIRTEVKSQVDKQDISRIAELSQENNMLKTQLNVEKIKLQNQIDSLSGELLALKEINTKTFYSGTETKKSEIIELKSENYDTLYQQKPKPEYPKIKLRVFTNPAKEDQLQINSNIFNK